MKSVRWVRYTLASHECWIKHPGTNGELTSHVTYARLQLLDFKLLQCIRMWAIPEGFNGCHYHDLPQNKPWDTLISNVATQPKHHAYVVSVDAKSAPSAKHTASRTSWLHTRKESRDVPVNFSWKLTKDKIVRCQSLELAGWYQTVPYLRLRSQMGWHIAIGSYLPIDWNQSGTYERKK
jgi:hypothetical protein